MASKGLRIGTPGVGGRRRRGRVSVKVGTLPRPTRGKGGGRGRKGRMGARIF